ncbi:MAG: hypothetical protein H6623_08150 [Bdellovibrionaceae bacterium]|nr:hypothetical protein [Pseudobdellovibrionaceae bacterium]
MSMQKVVALIGVNSKLEALIKISHPEVHLITIEDADTLDHMSSSKINSIDIVVMEGSLKGVRPQTVLQLFKCKRIYIGNENMQDFAEFSYSSSDSIKTIYATIEELLSHEKIESFIEVLFPNMKETDIYDFDIYTFLKLNEKFVVYNPRGGVWSPKKFSALKSQSGLYIKTEDEEKYLRYIHKQFESMGEDLGSGQAGEKAINKCVNAYLDEHDDNGPLTKSLTKIVSTFLTHDNKTPWNEALVKYSDFKKESIKAEGLATMTALVGMGLQSCRVDDLFYAVYFIHLVQQLDPQGGEMLGAVKRFINKENIILTPDTFTVIELFDQLHQNTTDPSCKHALDLFKMIRTVAQEREKGPITAAELFTKLQADSELDIEFINKMKKILIE